MTDLEHKITAAMLTMVADALDEAAHPWAVIPPADSSRPPSSWPVPGHLFTPVDNERLRHEPQWWCRSGQLEQAVTEPVTVSA
uniref:hypothetical protein n=1 Tax=Saccharothrix mutabilis TaxID=33921 RepID=UPI0031E0B3D3